MLKLRVVKRNQTLTIFNPNTGETLLDGNGTCDTPFLLDVSITSKCEFNCPYCYKKTSSNGQHMTMDDFEILLDRMKDAQVFQVAYGGGNPNEHPRFKDILEKTYEAGIIPNYSTNGSFMSDEIIEASAKYCGAVAVSIHNDIDKYEPIIIKMTAKIKKVNLHFIMKKTNYRAICSFLLNPPCWTKNINAVVLLRYKAIINDVDSEPSEEEYRELFETTLNSKFKVAFDACSFFLIKKYLPNVSYDFYDYCQGARSSAYVNENLIMSPCSFDKHFSNENDLHNKTIYQIFNESTDFIERRIEIDKSKVCLQHFFAGKIR